MCQAAGNTVIPYDKWHAVAVRWSSIKNSTILKLTVMCIGLSNSCQLRMIGWDVGFGSFRKKMLGWKQKETVYWARSNPSCHEGCFESFFILCTFCMLHWARLIPLLLLFLVCLACVSRVIQGWASYSKGILYGRGGGQPHAAHRFNLCGLWTFLHIDNCICL